MTKRTTELLSIKQNRINTQSIGTKAHRNVQFRLRIIEGFNKLVQTSGAIRESYTGRNPLDLQTEVTPCSLVGTKLPLEPTVIGSYSENNTNIMNARVCLDIFLFVV